MAEKRFFKGVAEDVSDSGQILGGVVENSEAENEKKSKKGIDKYTRQVYNKGIINKLKERKEIIMTKANSKLLGVEQVLKDLKGIITWADEHDVGLGEIVEMLSNYDHFVKAVDGDFDSDFEAFDLWIGDMIIKEIEEAK